MFLPYFACVANRLIFEVNVGILLWLETNDMTYFLLLLADLDYDPNVIVGPSRGSFIVCCQHGENQWPLI